MKKCNHSIAYCVQAQITLRVQLMRFSDYRLRTQPAREIAAGFAFEPQVQNYLADQHSGSASE